MGYIRQTAAKITGADVQADAVDRSATQQADAVRTAAEQSAKTAQEAAAQSAKLQESAAARIAAQGAAAETINKPLENPEVALTATGKESAVAAARRRRSTFGVGSGSTGVNI